jgi:hypothetical protein
MAESAAIATLVMQADFKDINFIRILLPNPRLKGMALRCARGLDGHAVGRQLPGRRTCRLCRRIIETFAELDLCEAKFGTSTTGAVDDFAAIRAIPCNRLLPPSHVKEAR